MPGPLALLALVPRQVWFGVAGASVLALGYCQHQGAVKRGHDAAYAAGQKAEAARWQGAFATMRKASDQWRANYETAAASLAADLGARHAETLRRNGALADDLRLRGPGKAQARCGPGGDPGLSARSGEHQNGAISPEPDAPRPDLPAEDRHAIVPWGWLVQRAKEHDALLSEVDTWRSWYPRERSLFDRRKLELPDPAFGGPPDEGLGETR